MSTNVPAITWVNGSPVLPAELDILAGVQADIDTAFGGGVNQSLQTPQGQLAQSETAIIGDKNSQIAYIANQINPETASGQWQDAIGAIYGIQRIQAAGTVVTATLTGAVGTVIPAGSKAQDSAGYIYASTAAVTIPATGTIDVQFQNTTSGPIACPAGSLSTIYIAIAGWDTITNAADGSLGNDVESRAAFELRRKLSVAGNAVNTVQSLQAAVLNVPNVIDAFVWDNPADTSITYGATSYSMAPHSVTVSVAGGDSNAVAKAIWNKKPPGCNYNGNTSVTVYDESYATPYPSYTVTYLQPTSTPVYFAVQIRNIATLPSNIVDLVKAAIVESFNGLDGGPKVRINSSTYSGRYYANISAIDTSVEVLSVLMGFTALTATNTSVTFGIDQLPSISTGNISVTLV